MNTFHNSGILCIVDDDISAFILTQLLTPNKITIISSVNDLSPPSNYSGFSILIVDLLHVHHCKTLGLVLDTVKAVFPGQSFHSMVIKPIIIKDEIETLKSLGFNSVLDKSDMPKQINDVIDKLLINTYV